MSVISKKRTSQSLSQIVLHHDSTQASMMMMMDHEIRRHEGQSNNNNNSPSPLPEDIHMVDHQASGAMFTMDERKCPCLLCAQGPPLILQRESVAWTSIIRVAFYVLHAIYPDLPYLSMKTHVSPYILRHWQALGIDKKGDNVKWKKHILDAIWHGDSFFESGTPVLKQTGVWRLINPKADPWLDSPSSSPVPRRKTLQQKKMRGSPTEELQQEYATSEPSSPAALQRSSSHQALPHISSLFRHVDDYWQSRSLQKTSPPTHRRCTSASYSPYKTPPVESRPGFAAPPSPNHFMSAPSTPEPIPISPPTVVNLIPAMNTVPTPTSPLNLSAGMSSSVPSFPNQPMSMDRPFTPTSMLPSMMMPSSPPQPLSPMPHMVQMVQMVTMQSMSPMTNVTPMSPTPARRGGGGVGPVNNIPQTLPPFSPSNLPLHNHAFSSFPIPLSPTPTPQEPTWTATGMMESTRALHMLPCVSALFQPAPPMHQPDSWRSMQTSSSPLKILATN